MSMSGWTDNGRLFAPHAGMIYWFKPVGKQNRHVTLTHVENLDGNDIPGDEFVVEDLPAPVRQVLQEENVRHVRETSTLAGAMA